MSTRGDTDLFKRRFLYVLSIFEKKKLEVGGVRVDTSGDTFTIFTPAGAAVHDLDDYEKWQARQKDT